MAGNRGPTRIVAPVTPTRYGVPALSYPFNLTEAEYAPLTQT
jgi:hypothetical protein